MLSEKDEVIPIIVTVVYNLEVERSAYPDTYSHTDICNYEKENIYGSLETHTPFEIRVEIKK
jgi:hypothetical protein